jgi:hypothetical protein
MRHDLRVLITSPTRVRPQLLRSPACAPLLGGPPIRRVRGLFWVSTRSRQNTAFERCRLSIERLNARADHERAVQLTHKWVTL